MARRRGARGPRVWPPAQLGAHVGRKRRPWPGSLGAGRRRRLGRAVGEPAGEGVQRAGVGAVVALREAHEVGPGEVRVAPRRSPGRRAHHPVLARAQEEGQRPPRPPLVHHRAVQAALVPPVRQRLHGMRVSTVHKNHRVGRSRIHTLKQVSSRAQENQSLTHLIVAVRPAAGQAATTGRVQVPATHTAKGPSCLEPRRGVGAACRIASETATKVQAETAGATAATTYRTGDPIQPNPTPTNLVLYTIHYTPRDGPSAPVRRAHRIGPLAWRGGSDGMGAAPSVGLGRRPISRSWTPRGGSRQGRAHLDTATRRKRCPARHPSYRLPATSPSTSPPPRKPLRNAPTPQTNRELATASRPPRSVLLSQLSPGSLDRPGRGRG
jgi:hypothetical protein